MVKKLNYFIFFNIKWYSLFNKVKLIKMKKVLDETGNETSRRLSSYLKFPNLSSFDVAEIEIGDAVTSMENHDIMGDDILFGSFNESSLIDVSSVTNIKKIMFNIVAEN